ncbi:phage tail tape measure protein [Rhodococcus sp. NPDC019627]|uniref:aggregation-promoting factor C-terminal-like domain-containing protein n=1 Tax=unclassified Rhodococcus (in: high G+C Gram-positive bacteria) TaxID=192944 RepID=UPI0037989B64
MADEDVLWVPVLPSLRGFASQLGTETRAAATRAGQDAGAAFAGGLERAEASVRKATDKLSAAQDKVADATGRRSVAQAKLNELEQSGRASASQLTAAQEAVERASRGVVAAQRNQETAARAVADANAAAARAAQEAGDAVEVQGRRFHGFGGSVSGAIGDLKGFAIAAAGIGGAMSTVGAAIEREGVGRKVAASFGESAEEAKRYGDLAGELYAGGLGGSLQDVQAAVQATAGVFGSLDTMGSARLGALSNKAQTLADVFDMDVAEAAETASSLVVNGFAGNADEAFDLLTRGMQEVSVSMRGELPEILQEYSTNFRGLGFDGKEAFNLLVSASQQGKFALDKTGDALKEFTLLGSDMSESSQEAYKAIGLDAEAMSRAVASGGDGAQEALQQTAAGLLKIEDPLKRANTAIALFGTPLEDLSVDQIPAFLQGLAGADDAIGDIAGATDDAGAVMYGGLGNKLELMKRGFQDTFVDLVGDDVLPLLGDFTGALEENEGSALAAIAGMTGMGGVVAGFETAKGTFDSVKDGVLGLRDGFLDAKDQATQAWSAVQSGAGWVKAQASAAASFVKTSATATVEATKTAAAWTGAQLKTAGGWVVAQARAVGAFVAMSASATANATRTAAAWVVSNTRVAASFVASRAAMVATTVATGAMTAAQWLLNVALNANPIGLLIAGLAALAGAIYLAWQNSSTFREIVMGAWEGIQAAASWAWENVLQPIFGFFVSGLQAIGAGATWLWQNAILPAFDGIGAVVSFWWNNIASPIINGAIGVFHGLGDAGMWLWQNAIQPAFDGIGAVVSWVWNNVVSPVFESMKTGVGLVGTAFESAVGFIGRVWDGVKAVAARPIKFVIDSVYNNGIREAWNKVAGWLGLNPLEEYKPEWLGAYASGGTLPGYSPGRDNMRFVSTDGSAAIDLSGGESILRPEVARAVGPGWVDGVNKAAASGGTGAVREYLGGYAGGGVVGSIVGLVQKYFPGMSITSTQRDTADYHGQGLAVDFSDGSDTTPGMQEAARFFFDNYAGELLELIHYPLAGWQNIDNGNPFDFGEPTNSQHRDHVHVAADHELGDPNGGGSIFGRVWSSVTGAVSDFMRRRVAEAFDSVISPIGASIPDFGGSLIGSVPRKAFDLVTGKVREWLLGKADEKDKAGAGGAPGIPGSGPVADQVRQAFAAYGWDQGAQWDAVDWIVGKESSWNPTARNPSSGAFGLFQFLGSTKDQYLPDENPNPGIQGAAGARYIRDRYGDPLAAKRFWEQNGWYDQGGLASGRGLMLKNVLDPERVLDPRQTSAFEQLVPWLVSLAGGIADQPLVQGAANAALPGAGVALDALAGGFSQIPGSAEFAGFMTQLPMQIFEETAKDTASFFGLGEVVDAAFSLAEPVAGGSSVPAPEPLAGADSEPPAGGAGPGAGGPLVVIEQLIVDNVNEAANAIGREARRLVRSDALTGGW